MKKPSVTCANDSSADLFGMTIKDLKGLADGRSLLENE
jgi:hypothetical protein